MTSDRKDNLQCWSVREDSDEWQPLTRLPWGRGREGISVSPVPDGFVVVGGQSAGKVHNECHRYSSKSGSWQQLPSMHTARWWAGAVTVGNRLFVIGGGDASKNPLGAFECLKLENSKWERHPAMLVPMVLPRVASVQDNVYVVFCTFPFNAKVQPPGPLSTQSYDPVAQNWQRVCPLPAHIQRTAGCCAVSVDNALYLVGGLHRLCARYTPAT